MQDRVEYNLILRGREMRRELCIQAFEAVRKISGTGRCYGNIKTILFAGVLKDCINSETRAFESLGDEVS